MLQIRSEQMKVFEEVALKNFKDEMVQHLNRFAAKHCEIIGEEKVRETIQLGITDAQKYGLTNRGPVRFYIEMMFMFGSSFDTDPQYPWAVAILNDQTAYDQMDRAELLHQAMLTYLEKVAGSDNIHSITALRRIRERVDRPVTSSNDSFGNDMLREMKGIYPQKCSYVGDEPLKELIHQGMKSAKLHSMQHLRGSMLFVVLMFALGHGFADDPLFPWIGKTLADPLVVDPEKKAERIEKKAITYLNSVLAYHDKQR